MMPFPMKSGMTWNPAVSTLHQRGYRLKDRLLRPAKVSVSRQARLTMAAEPMTKSRASASLGGALRAESSEGVLRVVFSGEWKRDLLGPNFFTERDEALRETERLLKEARSVELLGEALGEWDSGVLVVTTRLVTLAKEHNIPLDDAASPRASAT